MMQPQFQFKFILISLDALDISVVTETQMLLYGVPGLRLQLDIKASILREGTETSVSSDLVITPS